MLLSKPFLRLLVFLRLLDPTPAPAPSLPPRTSLTPPSSRPAVPGRSESKIGLNEVEVQPACRRLENRQLYIPLDLRTAPVIGCFILLATTTIDGSVVRLGIVGEGGARPYDVLVLFISLLSPLGISLRVLPPNHTAYISTALDSTGGLRALAFHISQKSARTPRGSPPSADKTASGLRLFTTLYLFWFAFGVLVGNDPIVLSGTAFLGYFTRATGITEPRAWTMSQFIAANVASAALVSSNPTNVLIAGVRMWATPVWRESRRLTSLLTLQAWELNFLTGFTAYTLLPTVIAALVAFPLLLGIFTFLRPSRAHSNGPGPRYIPSQLLPPDIDPRSALLDPHGAIFHTTLLLVTLATLVGTSFVKDGKVGVWMVTMPAGIIAFLRDIWSERKPPTPRTEEIELSAPTRPVDPPRSAPTRRLSLPYLVSKVCKRFPTTTTTISRLPLSLLTFAGGIFVLSRALTSLGWTDIFAGWLAKICINPAATVFFVGYFVAFVLCPLVGTNIGATILFVEILRSSSFTSAPHVAADPLILRGAIYSLALASNLGAFSWTVSASLAGLLWTSILKQKGISVSGKAFAAFNLPVLLVLQSIASAVVLLECYYFL
ncbi:SPOSA6832_02886, partial [Sporobolomyces salmonicolor]